MAINKPKNSKKHPDSSKLFIGAVVAVLLVIAVSNYGKQLTGYQVATGINATGSTLAVDTVSLDSIFVNGNTTSCSFSAVRFTSSRSDAFRFGSEWKSQVYWLAKNRSAGGCNTWNGYWVYQNASSIWTNTSGSSFVSRPAGGVGGIQTNMTMYSERTFPSTISIASDGQFGTARLLRITPLGNSRYVNITITELSSSYNYSGYGHPSETNDFWSLIAVFGAGSFAGSPTATDLGFRDKIGSPISVGQIRYAATSTGIFCTPYGRCATSPNGISALFCTAGNCNPITTPTNSTRTPT